MNRVYGKNQLIGIDTIIGASRLAGKELCVLWMIDFAHGFSDFFNFNILVSCVFYFKCFTGLSLTSALNGTYI